MDYQVGQYVMYRNSGVCQIQAIGTLDFLKNKEKKYYTLCRPFSTNEERNYIPVGGEKCVRAVLTAEDIHKMFARLKQSDMKPYNTKKRNLLVAHYQELLNSGDLSQELRLLKEIYLKAKELQAKGKKLSSTDLEYQKKAEQLACEEISIAFGESRASAKEHLYSALVGVS